MSESRNKYQRGIKKLAEELYLPIDPSVFATKPRKNLLRAIWFGMLEVKHERLALAKGLQEREEADKLAAT